MLFTTFYESAGSVDPETGEVKRFDALGKGLNELALIARGVFGELLVVASRYGSGSDEAGDGELVYFRADGTAFPGPGIPLPAPPGYRSAPKTPVFDERSREIWVTSDLLPLEGTQGPIRHDTFMVGEFVHLERNPEIQFGARGPDGTTHLAQVSRGRLELRSRPPDRTLPVRYVLLDDAFDARFDFAQDIHPAADGRVVVTRWSGVVHVVYPDGDVGTLRLPRLDPDGLYYSGVLHGDRLCVTHCADVTVVCADAPRPGDRPQEP